MKTRQVACIAALLLLVGCFEKTQDTGALESRADEMRADTPSAEGDAAAEGAGGAAEGEGGGQDPGEGDGGEGENADPAAGEGEAGDGEGGEVPETPPDPAANGGEAGPGGAANVEATTPFEIAYGDGPMVTISGTLVADEGVEGQVDIDCFAPDPDDPKTRELVNKLKVHQPGAYSMRVPKDFGQLILEAFIDADSDGPDDGDARGEFVNNPLVVKDKDIEGVDIELILPAKSAGGGAWRGGGRREGGTWRGGGQKEGEEGGGG